MRQIKPEKVRWYMDQISKIRLKQPSEANTQLIEKYTKLLSVKGIDLKSIVTIKQMHLDRKMNEQYFLIRIHYDYMRALIYNKDISLAEKTDIWNQIQKELLRLAKFLKSKGFKSEDNLNFKYKNWVLSVDYNTSFLTEMQIAIHNYHFFGTILRHKKIPIIRMPPLKSSIKEFTTQTHLKPFNDDND